VVHAIYNNDINIVKDYLQKGYSPNHFYNGRPLIFHAIYCKNAELVQLLLKHGGDLSRYNKSDFIVDDAETIPPFYYLFTYCTDKFIRNCFEGMDVNNICDREGNTLVHLIAKYGLDPVAIKCLLKLGADINAKNHLGRTPLFEAILSVDNIWYLGELINLGADVNSPDLMGNTPLFATAEAKKYSELKANLLIDRHSEINYRNRFDETPIFAAVQSDDVDLLTILIAKGADINIKNELGETALFCAVSRKAFDCTEVLLAHHAEASLFNRYKMMP